MDIYDTKFLTANLCFAYRMVQASAPLLEFALPKTSGDLHDYYAKHLSEETGHDEMLKRDLEMIGVTKIPRSFEAAKIAGSQYYLIAHANPAALLGYMHVLEKNALSTERVDSLEKAYGLKMEFFRHHAVHDSGHASDIEAEVGKLSMELRELVAWNAKCTLESLNAVFEGMSKNV